MRKMKEIFIDKKCENCAYQHTMHCPNSQKCYSTVDKPYFVTIEGLQHDSEIRKETAREQSPALIGYEEEDDDKPSIGF